MCQTLEESKEEPNFSTNALAAKPERSSAVSLLPKSNMYDIGLFYDKVDSLADSDVYDLVKNIWQPSNEYKFPSHSTYGKYRKFNLSWLQKFPWLAYSGSLNAAFCVAFVFLVDVMA